MTTMQEAAEWEWKQSIWWTCIEHGCPTVINNEWMRLLNREEEILEQWVQLDHNRGIYAIQRNNALMYIACLEHACFTVTQERTDTIRVAGHMEESLSTAWKHWMWLETREQALGLWNQWTLSASTRASSTCPGSAAMATTPMRHP